MSRFSTSFRPRSPRHLTTGPALIRPSERLFCLRAVALGLPDEVLASEQVRQIVLDVAQIQLQDTASADEVRALAAGCLADGTAERRAKSDVVYSNIAHLQTLVGLSPLDCDLLAIAVAAQGRNGVHACLGWLFGDGAACSHVEVYALLAAMAASTSDDVELALLDSGVLAATHLLRVEFSSGVDRCLSLQDECERALQRPGLDQEGLLAQFLVAAPPPELQPDDYGHMHMDIANLTKLLSYALQHATPGVNILIHGPAGTGKTQLSRVLARELAVPMYETPHSEDVPQDRDGRLRGLLLSQALLRRRPGALVVFDEVEDAFPHDVVFGLPFVHNQRRRAWHHQLLEGNPAPVLWIANTVSHLDPAMLRRFSVVVEVREPPRPIRLKMLEKALGGHAVSGAWLERAADDANLTPAEIARASVVAKALTSQLVPVEEALDWALKGHHALRPTSGKVAYRLERASYDLSFVHTNKDLPALVERLKLRPRATMCLSGPPGTGKTAFCAHLAGALGVPLIHAKASDLLDKYVGETEKRIARLFHSASEQGAVLLLDEADGLLRDRRGAVRSWEVTQVNEILCQMEAFQGVFACATNLPGELDPATLRRFHLKIAFKPLRPEQLVPAFWRVASSLGVSKGAKSRTALRLLGQLEGVCLGDLHAARRHCEILGDETTALDLARAVAEEVEARQGPRKAVGFRADGAGEVRPTLHM